MSKHNCDYGLLSSYHATIFAYRGSQTVQIKGKTKVMNVLFLSDIYEIGTASLSPIFAWFLHALKTPASRVPLPRINADLAAKFMSEDEIRRMELKENATGKFRFQVGPQQAYARFFTLRKPRINNRIFFGIVAAMWTRSISKARGLIVQRYQCTSNPRDSLSLITYP